MKCTVEASSLLQKHEVHCKSMKSTAKAQSTLQNKMQRAREQQSIALPGRECYRCRLVQIPLSASPTLASDSTFWCYFCCWSRFALCLLAQRWSAFVFDFCCWSKSALPLAQRWSAIVFLCSSMSFILRSWMTAGLGFPKLRRGFIRRHRASQSCVLSKLPTLKLQNGSSVAPPCHVWSGGTGYRMASLTVTSDSRERHTMHPNLATRNPDLSGFSTWIIPAGARLLLLTPCQARFAWLWSNLRLTKGWRSWLERQGTPSRTNRRPRWPVAGLTSPPVSCVAWSRRPGCPGSRPSSMQANPTPTCMGKIRPRARVRACAFVRATAHVCVCVRSTQLVLWRRRQCFSQGMPSHF